MDADIRLPRWMDDITEDDLIEQDGMCRLLTETIGSEHAKKFIYVFSGAVLYIPKMETIWKIDRDRKIIRDYRAGQDISKIARKYGVTESWVRRLHKREYQRMKQQNATSKARMIAKSVLSEPVIGPIDEVFGRIGEEARNEKD